MNDRSRPGEGGSEKTIAAVNTIMSTAADNAQQRIPAYVVLLTTRYGMPRRRVYLDLGAARTTVARPHDKNQPAQLMLCRLEPVAPNLDGEVAP